MAEVTEPSVTEPRVTESASRPWSSNGRWVSHSIGCPPEEWAEITEVAALSGQSTNGWIRQSLKLAAQYDRMNLEDGTIRGVE